MVLAIEHYDIHVGARQRARGVQAAKAATDDDNSPSRLFRHASVIVHSTLMAQPGIRPPKSWGHTTVHTACPLDCPDCCSLAVTIEEGRIHKIDGSRDAPLTDGFICGKVRKFDQRVYSSERVLYPSIRRGPKGRGDFTVVPWDEALDIVADRMMQAKA